MTSQDASGVTTYSYDAAGNQRLVATPTGARATSVWDDENRRVQVLLPTGAIVTSTYRADGLRYSKQDASGTTKFIWDENRYLAKTNETDETQVVYTNPPVPFGNVVSQYRKSGALWVPNYYHSDALGSARALTDSTQTLTDTYLYDAWGEEVSRTGTTTNPFQWVGALGYYRDPETGTYYVRARVYVPRIARWLSMDPLRAIDGPNLFLYVLLRPSNLRDPGGTTFRDKTLTEEEKRALKDCDCKTTEYRKPIPDAVAYVICKDGEPAFELNDPDLILHYESLKGCSLLSCIEQHEEHHLEQFRYRCPDICKGKSSSDETCTAPSFTGMTGVLSCKNAAECFPTIESIWCAYEKYKEHTRKKNSRCILEAKLFIWSQMRAIQFYGCQADFPGEDGVKIGEIYLEIEESGKGENRLPGGRPLPF